MAARITSAGPQAEWRREEGEHCDATDYRIPQSRMGRGVGRGPGRARLPPDLDLMVRDREIAFLGKSCPETGDVEIDCSQRLLLPGLINIHTHPSSEPLRKGITDETRAAPASGTAHFMSF